MGEPDQPEINLYEVEFIDCKTVKITAEIINAGKGNLLSQGFCIENPDEIICSEADLSGNLFSLEIQQPDEYTVQAYIETDLEGDVFSRSMDFVFENPLKGVFRIHEVTLAQDYKIDDITVINAGTDVTSLVSDVLLAAAPCDDPADAALESNANGELYLVCIGESGRIKAGTWTSNSTLSTLTLNLSSPPFPIDLQMNVAHITINEECNLFSGNINPLILPGEEIADLLPPGVDPPLAAFFSIDITISKIQ